MTTETREIPAIHVTVGMIVMVNGQKWHVRKVELIHHDERILARFYVFRPDKPAEGFSLKPMKSTDTVTQVGYWV